MLKSNVVKRVDVIAPSDSRLLSVNVTGHLHDGAKWTGSLGRSGIDKRPFAGPLLLADHSVEADSVINRVDHGGEWQAVYAYAREDALWWEQELGIRIDNGRFGENLTTVGLDITNALIGERWRIGSATLQVTVPRIPCRVFAGFWERPDLIKEFTLARRPGTYLRIVDEGHVAANDRITVIERPAKAATVAQAFACKTGDREHLDLLKCTNGLAPEWREWLVSIAS